MDFGPVLSVNIEAFDGLEKKDRVDAIDDAIHRLQFERRLTLLTEKQREHMCNESLSGAQRARLDQCKTDEEREEVINGYARATYFKRVAWISYLNGETPNPPIPADAE